MVFPKMVSKSKFLKFTIFDIKIDFIDEDELQFDVDRRETLCDFEFPTKSIFKAIEVSSLLSPITISSHEQK